MKQLSPVPRLLTLVHRPMTLVSRLLTLVLSLLSLVPCTLLANDGVYFASGNFLVPVKETDITVQKEVLEITLGKDSFAYVTVDYTFYNNSNEKKVTMAFEAGAPYNAWAPFSREGIHPFIKDFTVRFNGQPLQHRNAVVGMHLNGDKWDIDQTPLDLTQWKGFGEVPDSLLPMDDVLVNPAMPDSFCIFAYAYYFDAPFQKGENHVRHTYRYKMSYGVGRDFEVPYSLAPATRWANGQVDDFTLRIKAEDTRDIVLPDTLFLGAPFIHSRGGETYQIHDDIYGDCLFAELLQGDVLEWHSKNFSPKAGMCIQSVSILRRGIGDYANTGKVVVADDGWEGRYLADAGDNYFAETQEYSLVPKREARVELREAAKGQGFVYLKSDIRKANVREEPSMRGKVLFTIDNYEDEIPEYYPCLGYVSHKEADGFYKWWYKVEVDGRIGYISEKLLLWDSVGL